MDSNVWDESEPLEGLPEAPALGALDAQGRLIGPVVVVGLGLVGGSILRRLVAQGVDCIGADANPEVAQKVMADGYRVLETKAALEKARVVLVAVPPMEAGAVIGQALAHKEVRCVSDTASVKMRVVRDVWNCCGDDARYMPGHPIARTEGQGWEDSSAELLVNASWVLCPEMHLYEQGTIASVLTMATIAELVGAHIRLVSTEEHDKTLAYSNHLVHMVANALAGIGDGLPIAELSGASFRDVTRLSGSNTELWRQTLLSNHHEVISALAAFRQALDDIEAGLDGESNENFPQVWGRGVNGHERLERTCGALRWEARECSASVRELLAIGTEAIRNLRCDGETLTYEVGRPPLHEQD